MTDRKVAEQETEKEVIKAEPLVLEGLRVIGGKDSYNPNKKKKAEKEIVYTSPVKIGDKEYVVKPLSMFDLKKLDVVKRTVKADDEVASYDFSFHAMLTAVKKFNPEMKDVTIEQFQEMIDIVEFAKVQEAILQLSGLKKFFIPGVSK